MTSRIGSVLARTSPAFCADGAAHRHLGQVVAELPDHVRQSHQHGQHRAAEHRAGDQDPSGADP